MDFTVSTNVNEIVKFIKRKIVIHKCECFRFIGTVVTTPSKRQYSGTDNYINSFGVFIFCISMVRNLNTNKNIL